MSRPAEPRWVSVARAVHASSLWLYPRALRDAHGAEMRQAFRDRCREAVARGDGLIALLAGEWLPDLLRGAGEAHLAAPGFSSRPRQLLALGLLCVALLGLLLQDHWGRFAQDNVVATRNHWQELRYLMSLTRSEAKVRSLAAVLGSSADDQDRALAAYLYGALHHGRVLAVDTIDQPYPYASSGDFQGRLGADGDRATAMVASLRNSHSAPVLAAAARGCDPGPSGCNRGDLVRRLVALDPGNGYAWSLAFTEAARHSDAAGMAKAVQAMAASARYETYEGVIAARLFEAAAATDADPEFLGTVAWAANRASILRYEDWQQAVTLACTPVGDFGPRSKHWVDLHPQYSADCARVARLLAASSDLGASAWGWRRLRSLASDDAQWQAAQAQVESRNWLAAHVGRVPGEGHRWTPWTATQWAAWTGSWAPADGELPSLRRWMIATGRPLQAPAAFAADHRG